MSQFSAWTGWVAVELTKRPFGDRRLPRTEVCASHEAQAPFFRWHASEGSTDKLVYREAYTTFAAEEVVERLAQGFGLALDPEANPNSARSPPTPTESYTSTTQAQPLRRKSLHIGLARRLRGAACW